MEEKTNEQKWMDFVNPAILKPSLTYISVFIAFYESTADYIVETVRDVFAVGYNENGVVVGEKYKTSVLSLHKSTQAASLIWLKDNGCITDTEIATFDGVRAFRNHTVHRLLETLFDGFPTNLPQHFSDLVELRVKMEKWFVQNFEIPANPDFDDHAPVADDELMTSTQIIFRVILDMLDENEPKANTNYNELVKLMEQRKQKK